ncbi:DUF2779 domain-containing protein [Croceibacter atlanticus]|uniref:DUF2779 domain-containing protein n=1 Tax=Croceibacter atlanticus TaxID=313588 RepID=UPI0024BAC9A4|nr:DUF2779 domain-containing protein [Croceibacter atlanticus]
MPTRQRLLTKSRFKTALGCPTKLFYTRKQEYEDSSSTDSFLQALAEGGFQVEELARMEYPKGVAILGEDYNYKALAERTQELLKQENVVIFEPAFLINGLFIRVDILEKKGTSIKLIEVKAKSIDSTNHDSFFNKKGNLGWSEYLYDVAFQQFVIQCQHPEFKITPYLNLVDKSKCATVDGLNQCFKIVENSELRTGIQKKEGLTKADLGDPILCNVNVSEEVNHILNTNPLFDGQPFAEVVTLFQEHYRKDLKIHTPIGKHCKGCEFKNDNSTNTSKSGFHECWSEQLNLSYERINSPKTWDIWNFRSSGKLIDNELYFIDQLEDHHINHKPLPQEISTSERHWLQISKTNAEDNTPHIEVEGLRDDMKTWKFPMNFIDFETTAVAIPFTKGLAPYEQVAFQFSHHTVYEDGQVEHTSEFIDVHIGFFPNFDFIRALKAALEVNEGSIFRYHNHENTILNVIRRQLLESEEPDKEELIVFIENITHSTGNSAESWCGERDMIDLYQIVKRFYFHPAMNGSLSLKAVLPAFLKESKFLKQKYSQAIQDINLTSKNFSKDYTFLRFEDGFTVNPYKNLPSVYKNFTADELDNSTTGLNHLADGGTALTAYAKLQFTEVSLQEHNALVEALLRYCELDTLAMVMIYEHFKELTDA